MAVPKKKTSKARRDARRATHRISAPSLTVCPHCHHPVRPHHVCGNCGQYRGREVEPMAEAAPGA
jgi:large subunit ribosomal protein L32